MKEFLVIEGDNGTGKDTLAKNIETLGYEIITYSPIARHTEKEAKAFPGEEKLNSFLEYNKKCGMMAQSSDTSCIIIRYWVSTLAAAYADEFWNWEEIILKIDNCINCLPIPNLIIQLECDYKVRKERISKRGPSDDNITQYRDKRYKWALDKISKHFQIWESFDTTILTEEEVFQKVELAMKIRGLKS